FVVTAVDVRAGIFLGGSGTGDTIILTAGGAVTQDANEIVHSDKLLLLGSGSFAVTDDGNDVVTLAANTTGGVSYTDSNSLTIGTVNATSGVTTNNSPITLVTGNSGDLILTNAVDAGSGIVRLQSAIDISQSAGGVITAGALGVHTIGGGAFLDTAVNAVSQTFAGQADALNQGVLFHNANGVATGQVTVLDGFSSTVTGVSTNGGSVTMAADTGTLTVGTSGVVNSGISTGAAGNIVRLQATTGGVTQTAEGAIVSDLLGVRAGGAVALTAAPNDNAALTINATGKVDYSDAGDVTISAVAASSVFTALAAGVSSGGNDINLQISGNLLLNDAVGGTA